MPDAQSHRGAHPEDARDFAPSAVAVLQCAAHELSWLLERDYAIDASLKLVGDHHQLSARQRKAVQRGACPDSKVGTRRRKRVHDLDGRPLAIDGFNCLITVEAIFSNAPLFRGMDGALRDLASVHGTYRTVAETERALLAIATRLAQLSPSSVSVFLDRPVGNSGRTRAAFEQALAPLEVPLEIVLSDRVDHALVESGAVVASSDSWILDQVRAWFDLPAEILSAAQPWLIDFGGPAHA